MPRGGSRCWRRSTGLEERGRGPGCREWGGEGQGRLPTGSDLKAVVTWGGEERGAGKKKVCAGESCHPARAWGFWIRKVTQVCQQQVWEPEGGRQRLGREGQTEEFGHFPQKQGSGVVSSWRPLQPPTGVSWRGQPGDSGVPFGRCLTQERSLGGGSRWIHEVDLLGYCGWDRRRVQPGGPLVSD